MDIDDVDDRAPLPRELGRRFLRDEERRTQVGADELFPVRGFYRADVYGKKARGVVDEDVEPPEMLASRGHERPRRDRREKLGFHRGGALRAQRVQLRRELRRLALRIAVVQE